MSIPIYDMRTRVSEFIQIHFKFFVAKVKYPMYK